MLTEMMKGGAYGTQGGIHFGETDTTPRADTSRGAEANEFGVSRMRDMDVLAPSELAISIRGRQVDSNNN